VFEVTMNASPEVTGQAASGGGLMTQKAVAEFFGGVSMMTVWRWRHDSAMKFPEPVEINGRIYFHRDEIRSYRPPAKAETAA
jgi:predicted DNA-binding transcriptional regulator AlpA